MEKTFFLKTSSELCRRALLLRGVNSYMARLGSAWDSVPGPLKLLILLPHTRGTHHISSFRMDPAVLLHCSMPSNGSWPQDNHPQCSPTSSTCVQTKTLAPHQVERKQTLQYLQGLSAALSPKKKTQSGPSAGSPSPGGGCSQGTSITPAFLVPWCSSSRVVAQ